MLGVWAQSSAGVWAQSSAEVYSRTRSGDSPRPSRQQSCLWQRQAEGSLPPVCSHPAVHCLQCSSSKKNFFLYYFSLDLYNYRKPVDSSAKILTNWVVLRLEGSQPLLKGPPMPHFSSSCTITNHPCEKVRSSSLLLPVRHQSGENYYTECRKCFLWQQIRKCCSSCIQPACSCILKRASEQSFKFTGSRFSWTKASAPIIPRAGCTLHKSFTGLNPYFLLMLTVPENRNMNPGITYNVKHASKGCLGQINKPAILAS